MIKSPDTSCPRSFNSSDNVVSTTGAPVITSTSTTSPPPIPYNHQPEGTTSSPLFVTPLVVTEAEKVDDPAPVSEEQTEPVVQGASTGRAVDYRTAYPFGQLITPLLRGGKPQQYNSRPTKTRIYPQGIPSYYSSSSQNPSRYQASRPSYKKGIIIASIEHTNQNSS